MAEPDAAGQPPRPPAESPRKASRPLSFVAAIRQMERQTAPLVAEMERAAKLGRQLEAAAAPARRMMAALGLEEGDPPPRHRSRNGHPTHRRRRIGQASKLKTRLRMF